MEEHSPLSLLVFTLDAVVVGFFLTYENRMPSVLIIFSVKQLKFTVYVKKIWSENEGS